MSATVVKKYYDEEQTELEYEYFELNGEKHGEYKAYHQNGNLRISRNYVDGILHGQCIWYYENGKILDIYNYVNGSREGEYNSYDNTGKLEKHGFFKDNELI